MRIYVGNLPYQVTEEDVKGLFTAHGEVKSIELPWDQASGRPRGFCFIDMPNAEEAAAAVNAVNGHSLGGRTLVVNEARPMAPRSGPPRDSMGGG
ncbi:MAG: RNA-binding protein, partial [Candidatus Wallbacteria bacterium]|nr:RNA-binding protein [Candidatus Wallbacteria bacterium]